MENKIKELEEKLLSKDQDLQEAMDNYVQLDLQRVKEYNELVDLYKAKEQECDELKREKRNFYNFLTNKYNYGSFRPMWGAYLLRRFFKKDLGDFFDEKAYEMADTIEEKEEQLEQLKAENEELKKKYEENKTVILQLQQWQDKYLRQIAELKRIKDDFFKQAEISHEAVLNKNKIIEKLEEERSKYDQTFTEIKEIAEYCYDPVDKENDGFWTILQLISEVEND